MRSVKVINDRTREILFSDVKLADNIWSRFKGLQLQKKLSSQEGLLLRPCSSVHTFFMRFPLDLIHLDKTGRVLSITRQLKPWKIGPVVKSTWQILEVNSGTLDFLDIQTGDQFIFSKN